MVLRRPAEDRHQFFVGRTGLSGDRRCRLAQAGRGAVEQLGLVGPVTHLVAGAVDREHDTTTLGDQIVDCF
ncbi:hypothetical protein [Rhizobium mongolense]|uniref:hypothetical protein n=1 Tax=Rhizobium mongolense TaxID=57676 RepID=UPI00048F0085|nr:hypothetical protein [Rhizobium mongolense]